MPQDFRYEKSDHAMIWHKPALVFQACAVSCVIPSNRVFSKTQFLRE